MNPLKQAALKYLPPSWLLPLWVRRSRLRSPAEFDLMGRLIRPGSEAIDVGVYLGVFSYIMAQHARQVHAFEPNPNHLRFIRKALPNNVAVYPFAATATEDELDLVVPLDHPSAGSVSRQFDPGRAVQRHRIAGKPLDSFPFQDVSFLKVDAEGHEFAVLQGAQQLLEVHRPRLLLELEGRHLKRPMAEVFAELERWGYAGYYLQHGKLHPTSRFDEAQMQDTNRIGEPEVYINNFFFLPADDPERAQIVAEWGAADQG